MQAAEAKKMPPPFHGPQQNSLETIYYHHGFPIDPSTVQQSNFHTPKARKSLVEKIGKTLDKLTTNHHNHSHHGHHQVKHQALPPSVASTAAWIYPATFYQQ